MSFENFIIVGENIHCTRIVKRGGIKMTTLDDGTEAISFTANGTRRALRVPANWGQISAAYEKGNCKHVAVALHQVLEGAKEDRRDGEDYLCYVADRQIENGATFLDVNVDEYSSDGARNADVMEFLVKFLGERYSTPLSIDSSHAETLAVGLRNCRSDIRPPMVNSISLEREEAVDIVKQYNADAIVSAAGHNTLPANTDERLANFTEILGKVEAAGISRDKLHLDPLVLPVSTDYNNGKYFLEATSAARDEFAGVHLNGGFSNISFGMPNRKLLNMVFIWLCVEAGSDGGIIDPAVMPIKAIASLDTESEAFQIARNLLTGQDEFGMEYITAFRAGKLGE